MQEKSVSFMPNFPIKIHQRQKENQVHFTKILLSSALYLGTQLGEERSISQVAKRFMGTGIGPEPAEPRTSAPAPAPAGTAVGAGPPTPPLPGFRKAARSPPLSRAAAIITSTGSQLKPTVWHCNWLYSICSLPSPLLYSLSRWTFYEASKHIQVTEFYNRDTHRRSSAIKLSRVPSLINRGSSSTFCLSIYVKKNTL